MLITFLAVFALAGAPAALAADAATVADDAASVGYYLDSGVTISSSDATQIVSAARNGGSRFYLVVLGDTPDGGDTVFAENVLDSLGSDTGTVLVLSPEDVGWVSNGEFSDAELVAAFEYANARGGSDADYAANFVVSLVGAPGATTTAPPAGTTSGGSGAGIIWFFVIIAAVILLVVWLMWRSNKQTVNAAAEQLAKARLAVQKQVDAVANDILDMEDEVRVAGNAEADRFYSEASETYRTVSDELTTAETPQQLLDISNRLDAAIWQLDTAEALLDGKPRPAQPEPRSLKPDLGSEERVTAPPRQPDYQRRSSRRSSYLGPGMLDILAGVAGQVLAGGGRSGRRGFGGMFGGGVAGGSPGRRAGGTVTRRASGGARRASGRRSSPRRSGGGRVRGGGRRGR